MAHHHRATGRGGAAHLLLAIGFFAAAAFFGNFGEPLREAVFGKAGPRTIRTVDAEQSKCDSNTVSTIVGTIGCGSVKTGARLSSVVRLSATKK